MGQFKAKADIQKNKNKKGTMQNFIQNCIVPFLFLNIKASKALQRTV